MSSTPKKTSDLTDMETNESEVIRKPITFPVEPDDDEATDGPRSTKNDREIKLDLETSGEADAAEDSAPAAAPEGMRKPIVIEAEPED